MKGVLRHINIPIELDQRIRDDGINCSALTTRLLKEYFRMDDPVKNANKPKAMHFTKQHNQFNENKPNNFSSLEELIEAEKKGFVKKKVGSYRGVKSLR